MTTIKISQLPDASQPLTGAELLPLVQSGITKKALISSLTPFANVMSYGAAGDGVTDDTAAIQNAVNANDAVYFPSGTYKVSSAVSLKANNTMFGEGASSVILYTGTAASQGAFYVNSGSATVYVDNVTIQDLKFVGQSVTAGFNEFIHLISMNGVRNCLIERCVVEAFRGDGIYIGSGDIAGQERHNINVIIRDNYIDGVNWQNRNGISVIDGTGVFIESNYITRASQASMPGAIDIEPDSNLFHIVRNISIRNNRIYDCRGGVAEIGVLFPIQTYTNAPNGFLIEGNYIDKPSAASNNAYGIFFQYGGPFNTPVASRTPPITDATPNLGIRILNNYVQFPSTGPGRCFVVWNVNDITISNNEFIGGTTSLIGYPNTYVYDLSLTDNTFNNVNGGTDNWAVSIYGAARVAVDRNTFKNCGGTSGAARGAIEFNGSQLVSNGSFATASDWTTGTGWSIAAGVATKTAGTASLLSQLIGLGVGADLYVGATYQLTYTITRSAGSITPQFTGGTTVSGTTRSAAGTYTETLTAVTGNVNLAFSADSAFAGTVDNVTLNLGLSNNVALRNNVFLSPAGAFTQQAVRDSGHTFSSATNQFFGNIILDGANQFQSLYSDTIETSWTPVVEGGGSAGSGTYTLQFGRYRRIGKLVFFRLKVAVSAGHTGTGVIEVSLPTTVQAELNNEETACSVSADGVASTGGQIGWINPAATVGTNGCVRIYQTATGTTNTVTIPAGAFTVYAAGYYVAG